MVLDLARLDRIGGILGDHLVQIWYLFSKEAWIIESKILTFNTHLECELRWSQVEILLSAES